MTLPAMPADAAAAPWTWTRAAVPVSIAPHGYYSVRAFCPGGYSAITGGLDVPIGSEVYRNAEYRWDDGSGSSWFVALENPSNSSGSASVVAECVQTSQLPAISYNYVDVARGSDGYAGTSVPCLNAGEVALTGGAGWNNVNSRTIDYSGPTWSGDAWIARGWNSVAGAKLTVEVYCVSVNDLPGWERVELDYSGSYFWKTSIACPPGKRILNGGTQPHFGNTRTYASYPSITTWTASAYHISGSSTYLRAWCVAAGTPTVEITAASPGPEGSATSSPYANFSFTGTDPAGYPNSFRCSLDGAPPAGCSSGIGFGPLGSGSHTLVVWNTTPDGRSSNLATYHWTVDTVAPAVTVQPLPSVTLPATATVTWSGSDEHSGIDRYQAAYRLAHTDGTFTSWRFPAAWSDLTSTSVRTPSLAQGDSICVVVRAYDVVGNVSSWTAPTCTSRPQDDRALVAGTAWTRATGSQYWLQTVTETTTLGATLTRADVHLSRVGVVATMCGTCGTVVVMVGSDVIGEISLSAGTTRHKQVLLLPKFASRTGTVKIRVSSSAKDIKVDGLVVIEPRPNGPA